MKVGKFGCVCVQMSNRQYNVCGQQEASRRCVIFSADCVKTMGSYCNPDVAIKAISLKFLSVTSLKVLDEKVRFQSSSIC